jgi:hypothetical protein
LFDIPLPIGRAPDLPPEELRRRQLGAMVALILASARSQPVVLAFEDLHWADPTSRDLMRALAERGGQAPLLVVATRAPNSARLGRRVRIMGSSRSLPSTARRWLKWSGKSRRTTRCRPTS